MDEAEFCLVLAVPVTSSLRYRVPDFVGGHLTDIYDSGKQAVWGGHDVPLRDKTRRFGPVLMHFLLFPSFFRAKCP